MRRRKVYIFLAAVLALALVAVVGISIGSGGRINPLKLIPFFNKSTGTTNELKINKRVNVLLIGVDQAIIGQRPDTLALVSYDPKGSKIEIISIPTSAVVDIPGHDVGEAARAYQLGRARLMVATVEYLVGTEIDYYMKIDRKALQKAIDDLKGLNMGGKTLSGTGAVDYVRGTGKDKEADSIKRQQTVLKLLDAKMKGLTAVELVKMITDTKPDFDTDMKAKYAAVLAQQIVNVENSDILFYTLPMKEMVVDNRTLYQPLRPQIDSLMDKLFGKDRNKNDKQASRIRVLNGSGEPGLANDLARILISNGYRVIDIKNADRFDYPETELIVYSSDSSEMIKANQVKGILGIGKIYVNNLPQDVADMTIIVGKDYAGRTYVPQKTVEILNGSGNPSLTQVVKDKLASAGYNVVMAGNADKSDYPTTQIIVQVDNDQVKAMAANIKDVMGIGDISIGAVPRSDIEVTVIIGADQ